MSALVSKKAAAHVKAELRNSWLLANYIQVVARVINARSKTSSGRGGWTFSPAVAIDTLPGEEQERAQKLYAAVTREDEAKIISVMEDSWKSYQSTSGLNDLKMSPELAANIKQEWLVHRYLGIVSEIVSASTLQSAAADGAAQPSASRKRSREASAGTFDNAPTPKKASAVTDVAAQPGASPKRCRAASAATSDDAPTPKTKIRRRCGETSTAVRVKKTF